MGERGSISSRMVAKGLSTELEFGGGDAEEMRDSALRMGYLKGRRGSERAVEARDPRHVCAWRVPGIAGK